MGGGGGGGTSQRTASLENVFFRLVSRIVKKAIQSPMCVCIRAYVHVCTRAYAHSDHEM